MGGSGRTGAAGEMHRGTGEVQELMVECGTAEPTDANASGVTSQHHHAPLLCGTVLFLQLMIAGNAVEKNITISLL